jgi:ubiquinone/menaquinone biosynthesis C-methylase UbiE
VETFDVMLNHIIKIIHEPIYKYRLEVLSGMIIPFLNEGDKVLDIGCGSGRLGEMIMKSNKCPKNLKYTGIEKFPRGGEPIEVIEYDWNKLPMKADSFDIVILADVLHHDKNPLQLLREAERVSKKKVLIKDHKKDKASDQLRISFLDLAANKPHGIKCFYKYNTLIEWHSMIAEAKLTIEKEQLMINLYPWLFDMIFGKNLQYFCVCIK